MPLGRGQRLLTAGVFDNAQVADAAQRALRIQSRADHGNSKTLCFTRCQYGPFGSPCFAGADEQRFFRLWYSARIQAFVVIKEHGIRTDGVNFQKLDDGVFDDHGHVGRRTGTNQINAFEIMFFEQFHKFSRIM